ncbi:putative C-type lectin 3 protein [Naja naja]|nr:putative C-type lectin 3 protein [Naja naja]
MLLITCFIFGLLGSLTWAGSQWFCYKFYEDRLNFQEAEGECQEKWRGHLASVKSEKESLLIDAYVTGKNIESHNVWIGLQRDEGSNLHGGWRWTDGSSSRYSRWFKGEPNNVSNKEYCVGLYPLSGSLYWNDLNCRNKLPFLCKWTPA